MWPLMHLEQGFNEWFAFFKNETENENVYVTISE